LGHPNPQTTQFLHFALPFMSSLSVTLEFEAGLLATPEPLHLYISVERTLFALSANVGSDM